MGKRLITIEIVTEDATHCDHECCIEWERSNGFNWFRCLAFRQNGKGTLLTQQSDGRLLRCAACRFADGGGHE